MLPARAVGKDNPAGLGGNFVIMFDYERSAMRPQERSADEIALEAEVKTLRKMIVLKEKVDTLRMRLAVQERSKDWLGLSKE